VSKPKHKAEYGDFQTPLDLAQQVCELLVSKGVEPATVIEPTCGMGNFLVAAVEHFPDVKQLFGLEINARYLASATENL
jgi:type I restriction-modification system DNA methylase subunit